MRYTPVTPPKGPLSENALKLLRVLATTADFRLGRWDVQKRSYMTGPQFAAGHRALQRRGLAKGTDSWSTPELTDKGVVEAIERGYFQNIEDRKATDLAASQSERLRYSEQKAESKRWEVRRERQNVERIRAKLIPILAQAQRQGWSAEFTALVVVGS
jgi:hypothetical protein